MKVVFLSHYFYPHIGGVEKHVYLLSRELVKRGCEVTVITEKYDTKLKSSEIVNGIRIIRFKYPKRKFIGILSIWYFLWMKRIYFTKSDIIHIHDVFIWYLPLRIIYPTKKVFTTIHGYEPDKPFSKISVFQKKLAVKLSTGTIGVGGFLEKYLNTKFNFVTYGAVNTKSKLEFKNKKNSIVFIGRLSRDTGILKFLKYLKTHRNLNVDFVGDGELRSECAQFGMVHGFTDPQKFLEKSQYAVAGGYLSCLEAMANKCKIKVFWQDKLKKDYWMMSPMYKFIKNEDVNSAYEWVKGQNWERMADNYIDLWHL